MVEVTEIDAININKGLLPILSINNPINGQLKATKLGIEINWFA